MTDRDRESARKYVSGRLALTLVDKIIEAFQEPHEDCGIENLRDWIKARGFQIQMIDERKEKGLHSELCHHCAYIEHLLTALVE